MPTPEPTPEPTPSPTPEPTPELTTAEATLLARTTSLECGLSSTTEAGFTSTASVVCVDPDPAAAVESVEVSAFEDPADLRDAWRSGLEPRPGLKEVDEACANETPGARKWGFGNIACLVDGGTAVIRWTDARIGALGEVRASDGEVATLYAWWRANARRIGRAPEDGGDTRTQEPAATPKPRSTPRPKAPSKPLVRVPGAPRAPVCTAAGITIPDEWDRSWRLRTVEFLDRTGYERVVLKLVRTGRNRTETRTRAKIERMSLGRLQDVVPGAPKPRRGKAAIVVDLDGVRQAPTLRSYRPDGLTLARELSVVRSAGGHTVVIATPTNTCYQMRIPVWGSNATGKEGRAEIYIDLKPPSR